MLNKKNQYDKNDIFDQHRRLTIGRLILQCNFKLLFFFYSVAVIELEQMLKYQSSYISYVTKIWITRQHLFYAVLYSTH